MAKDEQGCHMRVWGSHSDVEDESSLLW